MSFFHIYPHEYNMHSFILPYSNGLAVIIVSLTAVVEVSLVRLVYANERCAKTVVFFHEESTFMSNEDQSTQWGMKGEKMLKPKSKGSGIWDHGI